MSKIMWTQPNNKGFYLVNEKCYPQNGKISNSKAIVHKVREKKKKNIVKIHFIIMLFTIVHPLLKYLNVLGKKKKKN